jgi:hypothetical protein
MAYNTPSGINYYTVNNISGTATGATQIFTPSARFTPLFVTFQLTSVSGFLTVATISLGTNASSYNNILTTSVLTGLGTVNNILTIPLSSVTNSSVAASTALYVNVTSVAVASTYVFGCTILGIYI